MPIKQRVRSPRYPSLSLPEAEAAVKKIFDKDGMNPVDRDSAVQHIGYSSLNGASATALASLKQFGLTSDAGKRMLQVTSLALDLIEPESDADRTDALKAAAFNPDLFASLNERFPETIPSENNLRAHLLRQEFTSAAVKVVVPAYLETCEYLSQHDVSERSGRSESAVQESPGISPQEQPAMEQNLATTAPRAPAIQPVVAGSKRMIFDAIEGEVAFTYPDNLSEDSIEDLEEWFALVVKRLRRAAKH
ncbi:MAG: hypothetical protein R8G34_03975 [Paracoccaceae bacterium]|nr:hypothetical protein [Paracoccaceae bacterium]